MRRLEYVNGTYRTKEAQVSALARAFPTVVFYPKIFKIIYDASIIARRGGYDASEWVASSLDTLEALESVGVRTEVTGTDNFTGLDGPCVFIGNHMSTFETFVMPGLIQPYKNVTFVIKKALSEYPVFRHVINARDPITVGRENPRDDLRAVLQGGKQRLEAGTSLVIFPQTTRADTFDPAVFNSIGIKLARNAGVPVVPVALKTDAWRNGKIMKDFGSIDPSVPAHFCFGKPMHIEGQGKREHQAVVDFIAGKFREWE